MIRSILPRSPLLSTLRFFSRPLYTSSSSSFSSFISPSSLSIDSIRLFSSDNSSPNSTTPHYTAFPNNQSRHPSSILSPPGQGLGGFSIVSAWSFNVLQSPQVRGLIPRTLKAHQRIIAELDSLSTAQIIVTVDKPSSLSSSSSSLSSSSSSSDKKKSSKTKKTTTTKTKLTTKESKKKTIAKSNTVSPLPSMDTNNNINNNNNNEELQLDSTRRKRARKMNRHQYKKRMKLQRKKTRKSYSV